MSDNLENWIARISENDLPIFQYTVNAVNDVVSNDDASILDLSRIILRDANLTARVLRLANTPVYNATGSTISTVSRAIVYIGFDLVRDMSMSMVIIEALLQGKEKEREIALKLMAKSFHAAVQARDFAERRGDDEVEEIFIAALLRYLGEITFWCVAGNEAKQIRELVDKRGFTPKLAQTEVLGFTFDELTVALTNGWHLSDLLHTAIQYPDRNDARIQDITLALEFAEKSSKSWTSKETISLSEKIAKKIGVTKKEVMPLLRDNARQGIEVVQSYGADTVIKYFPVEEDAIQEKNQEYVFDADCPLPDSFLQLNILRDLSGILADKPNFNMILEVILEGIYRGVGLDRAVFALMLKDKSGVRAKYALGRDSAELMSRFNFSLQSKNIFSEVINLGTAYWINNTNDIQYRSLINKDIRLVLGCEKFYLAPLMLAGKPIGVIYADRQVSGRDLDIESYDSFKHFVQQAGLALQHVSPK